MAAGLVMWFHFDQKIALLAAPNPGFLAFLHTVPHGFDLGRMGVMIFFAISGFVIYRSFEGPREGAARRFIIRRFCRLYPAYWVSLLTGLLIWRLTGQAWNWQILGTNATMAAGWLGQPRLLGVYWTLEIELLFYGCCLGLHLTRSFERRWLLAGLVVLLSILPRLLRVSDHRFGTHLGLPTNSLPLGLGLAVMFWGALFRVAYDETGGFRHAVWRNRTAWLVALLAVGLVDLPDPNVKWFLLGRPDVAPPGHLSVLAGLLVFSVWVAWWRVDNRVLTYLGVISYSLYLFHPLAKYGLAWLLETNAVVRGWNLPLWTCCLMGAAFTVLVAAGVYSWVERPAITLGKRWAGIHRGVLAGSAVTVQRV